MAAVLTLHRRALAAEPAVGKGEGKIIAVVEGGALDLYLAEFESNLENYVANLDYAEGWTWFDADGNALSDEEVAAMTARDKAQAFIEGRYAASDSGGMGGPGGPGEGGGFAGMGKRGNEGSFDGANGPMGGPGGNRPDGMPGGGNAPGGAPGELTAEVTESEDGGAPDGEMPEGEFAEKCGKLPDVISRIRARLA